MTERELPPLERWADVARQVFWTSWALVPLMSLLDSWDVIDRGRGLWLWVAIAVSVVWTLSLASWAVGAWRRRHRPRPPDDPEAEARPT